MAEKSRISMRAICIGIIVLCIALLAGGGQMLPDVMEKMQMVQLKSLGVKLMPLAINFLLAALVFSVAYLLYRPTKAALTRTLDHAGAHERGKVMVLRTVQLFYWGITAFVVASLVAPDFLGKLFLGISVFTAALALALKDIASDFFSGTLMQVTRRFNVGDDVEMIGVAVKGKVADIGYLSTRITNADGVQIVPNRNMWGNSVKILKQKSLIIIPPGVKLEKPEPKDEDDGTPKIFQLFTHK